MTKGFHLIYSFFKEKYSSFKERRFFKKRINVIVTFLTLLCISIYFFGSSSQKHNVVLVKYGDLEKTAIAIGHIVPVNVGQVKSTLSGTVVQVFHDIGNYVNVSDSLIQVKPNPKPQDLILSWQSVNNSKSAFKVKESIYKRIHNLYTHHLVSKESEQIAYNAYEQAKSNYNASIQNYFFLISGATNIGDKKVTGLIKSPISGYILQRNVHVGDSITSDHNPNEPVIFLIANLKDMVFQGSVDELDINNIQKGQPVTVVLATNPDQSIPGFVDKIGVADLSYRVSDNYNMDTNNSAKFFIRIRVAWPKNFRLRVGYSATANILIHKKSHVLILPIYTLHFENNKPYVYVLKNNNLSKVYVQLGLEDGIYVEIKQGLSLGEKIVTDINYNIQE